MGFGDRIGWYTQSGGQRKEVILIRTTSNRTQRAEYLWPRWGSVMANDIAAKEEESNSIVSYRL